MANLDHSKKMLVRVALVSGSTVATLVGAQTVAMLDQTAQVTDAPASVTTEPVALSATATLVPQVTIIHQAPSVVILRSSQSASPSQPSATTNNARPLNNAPVINQSSAPAILPPNPQEISAPAPIIVQQQQQQQAPAVSRSSR